MSVKRAYKKIIEWLPVEEGIVILILFFACVGLSILAFFTDDSLVAKQQETSQLSANLASINKNYISLKSQDQYKRNQTLESLEKNIQTTYKYSISAYQDILDLEAQNQKVDALNALYVATVADLGDMNYSSASAALKDLKSQIRQKQDALAAASSPGGSAAPVNATASNIPPKNGFNQQYVKTGNGTFLVDIIAADLNSTRVIVDTASGSDCGNNCPVLPLSDYISRNGAWAGINGTFFCPTDYPSCAGKTGSFDTLLMNKNKTYFNSANNIYSTVPAVIISGTNVRFVTASEQWGRSTAPDMVLAMQPLLVLNNQIVFSGSGDAKYNSIGTRGFIANIGSTVYIGDVLGANMQDSADVLKTLGMNNALNLDEGGSTALWYGGYKLGPGRNIPNAVLFVNK